MEDIPNFHLDDDSARLMLNLNFIGMEDLLGQTPTWRLCLTGSGCCILECGGYLWEVIIILLLMFVSSGLQDFSGISKPEATVDKID